MNLNYFIDFNKMKRTRSQVGKNERQDCIVMKRVCTNKWAHEFHSTYNIVNLNI